MRENKFWIAEINKRRWAISPVQLKPSYAWVKATLKVSEFVTTINFTLHEAELHTTISQDSAQTHRMPARSYCVLSRLGAYWKCVFSNHLQAETLGSRLFVAETKVTEPTTFSSVPEEDERQSDPKAASKLLLDSVSTPLTRSWDAHFCILAGVAECLKKLRTPLRFSSKRAFSIATTIHSKSSLLEVGSFLNVGLADAFLRGAILTSLSIEWQVLSRLYCRTFSVCQRASSNEKYIPVSLKMMRSSDQSKLTQIMRMDLGKSWPLFSCSKNSVNKKSLFWFWGITPQLRMTLQIGLQLTKRAIKVLKLPQDYRFMKAFVKLLSISIFSQKRFGISYIYTLEATI